MRQSLVPALLLATVALSSSNVLPTLFLSQLNAEPLSLGSQQNDNTFSDRDDNINILNDIIYKSSFRAENNYQPPPKKETEQNYLDTDNKLNDNFKIFNKLDHYNGEGFRKEQWHNYPRQLDRLHSYLYTQHNADKRNLDPDDPGNEYDGGKSTADNQKESVNYIANDIPLDSNVDKDIHKDYDATFAATSPLFILKIRLACLDNQFTNTDLDQYKSLIAANLDTDNLQQNEDDKQGPTNEINPAINIIKVKREDVTSLQDNESAENHAVETNTVQKRIFSLWSRLQSLSHKGHELQHRRHLHAFYGLPNSDGGGALTAETRAILMRPPGSPLRWG